MTPRSCTTSTLSFEVMQIIETPDSVEPPKTCTPPTLRGFDLPRGRRIPWCRRQGAAAGRAGGWLASLSLILLFSPRFSECNRMMASKFVLVFKDRWLSLPPARSPHRR